MLRVLLSLMLAVSLLTTAAAYAQLTVLTFDEPEAPTAPCTFAQAEPLTTQYKERAGVVFSGPMEVLNECGNFGIVEHSAITFLAWNITNSQGEPPRQTLAFVTPVSNFSFLTGSQENGDVTATAYDPKGRELATKTITLKRSAMRLVLDAENIAKVVITSTAAHGAIDDIRYVRQEINPASPSNTQRPPSQ